MAKNRWLAVSLVLVALSSCKSLDSGAKETFSKQFSCPDDRVTVRPRPDVDTYAATFGPGAEPAADVKKDPARYAMWKKDQADSHESFNDRMKAFEAKGCGKEVFYGCSHPNSGRNGAMNYADASCAELNYPPGGKKK